MLSTVIVTGCAGFIGSHLSEQLLAAGHKVIGIDNFDPFYKRDVKERNLSSFKDHPHFRFIEVDLADGEALRKSLEQETVDVIVHLAGKAGVRPSIEDPNGYIRANIVATQNILDLMKDKGIKKLAFASSSSVYGNTKETPFHEEQDVSNPISPYAFTKKACELINYTYHSLYELDIINLRFFTVFGPRQRPDLAIHKFTRLILSGEEIPMFGDGSTSRDYTYYEDTVAGIRGAISYLENNARVYETINLGNNQPVTLSAMISAIEKATGIKANIKQLPMQLGDVDITFANIGKAQELLGYNPKYSFEEGVKNFVDWYRSVNPS
ncbi:GDP-mannose 4,6-dehydratase [Sunxiuqinia elliptica]|uniref:Nucleoside-diphosphate-sugar epimerase n=1 Tax=Sunxiuqinia elliptica TaxID=655355 RepID=A0A4V6PRW8_9BACT|nr:GDP-mannose 4,6-dehydratase [Sunxiuqinia elliptica]TDO04929.1 nucleoside-diphosphate-sugar epimerase [Sunxiuqinia elliptica]TDO64477.1 nucleoside-diphosphate-sugar epimerase [Sunxiuqinia elliptica]